MLLAIEQGNTNTVFAVHDGQGWVAQWRTATESSRTADEYAVWLSQFLNMQGLALKVLTPASSRPWCRSRCSTSATSPAAT